MEQHLGSSARFKKQRTVTDIKRRIFNKKGGFFKKITHNGCWDKLDGFLNIFT